MVLFIAVDSREFFCCCCYCDLEGQSTTVIHPDAIVKKQQNVWSVGE